MEQEAKARELEAERRKAEQERIAAEARERAIREAARKAAVEALKWYRDEADAIRRNSRSSQSVQALLASVTVLENDGGKRACAALSLNAPFDA